MIDDVDIRQLYYTKPTTIDFDWYNCFITNFDLTKYENMNVQVKIQGGVLGKTSDFIIINEFDFNDAKLEKIDDEDVLIIKEYYSNGNIFKESFKCSKPKYIEYSEDGNIVEQLTKRAID